MAIEVKHRIEASLKVDVSVLDLLQEITIAQLAVRILSASRASMNQPTPLTMLQLSAIFSN